MRIQYIGMAGRRVIGDCCWTGENGFVVDVGPALAAELLTYPRRDFVLDRDEPLAAVLEETGERLAECAAALALEGIGSLEGLAHIQENRAIAVGFAAGVSVETVFSWAETARALVENRAASRAEQHPPETGEEE